MSAAVLATVFAAGPVLAQSPEISIEKSTNGSDADSGPGPVVEPGQPVNWTWTVTAVGSVTLYDLVVTDSSGVVPSCDVTGDGQADGTNIHPGPIEPGQSFTCSASGAENHDPAAGPFSAVGTVRASDFAASSTFQDDDPSTHTVNAPVVAEPVAPEPAEPQPVVVDPPAPDPGLSIQALVNGQVASGESGPLVAEGTALTWTYVVTNTGNVPLSGIEVADEGGLTVDCGAGNSTIPGPLAPGKSVSCTAEAEAAAQTDGPQSRIGSVIASGVDPSTGSPVGQVTASDRVTYTPVQVPARLAFTGPSSLVLPFGLALTAIGTILLVLAHRRSTVETAAPVPARVDERNAAPRGR